MLGVASSAECRSITDGHVAIDPDGSCQGERLLPQTDLLSTNPVGAARSQWSGRSSDRSVAARERLCDHRPVSLVRKSGGELASRIVPAVRADGSTLYPKVGPGAIDVYERRAEPFIFVLAAASVPLLLLEDQWPPARWLGFVIVGVFAVDLAVRVLLTPTNRWRYLRSHWLDALIVVVSVLPFLRPLRLVRAIQVLRIARLVLLAAKTWSAAQRVWGELRGKPLLFGCGMAGFVSLFVVYASERAAPDSSIHSAETTLWWAVTTVTTVGYGDTSPVTLEGRIAAGMLMLAGISIFGVITANISARFISQRDGAAAKFCPTCGAPLPRISAADETERVRDERLVEPNASS